MIDGLILYKRGRGMKFSSWMLVAGVVLVSFTIQAKEIVRDEGGPSTWYDQVDNTIESLALASEILYGDAQSYRDLTDKIGLINDSLDRQAVGQAIMIAKMRQTLELAVEKIATLSDALEQANRRINELESQSATDEIQKQFEIDGEKAIELVGAVKNVKSEYSQIVRPEKNAMIAQLEGFFTKFQDQVERDSEQRQQIVQALIALTEELAS